MMNRKYLFRFLLAAGVLFLITLFSCKKDAYYKDTGKHEAKYNGNILQYLQNNPYGQFTLLTSVIKQAKMEDVVQKEEITFFATPDSCIRYAISQLNLILFISGKDSVTRITQLKPEFWKSMLSMYIFKGARRLQDYPQIDLNAIQAFGGQYYKSYGGKILNIGVEYQDAGGAKYAGYRQLRLGYFSGEVPSYPFSANIPVASSDINPDNGIVHVLQSTGRSRILRSDPSTGMLIEEEIIATVPFGFTVSNFVNTAITTDAIDYTK